MKAGQQVIYDVEGDEKVGRSFRDEDETEDDENY